MSIVDSVKGFVRRGGVERWPLVDSIGSRLARRMRSRHAEGPAPAADLVDVRQLMSTYTVEQLNTAAEEQMAQVKSWDYHLARPFSCLDETPSVLIQLGKL